MQSTQSSDINYSFYGALEDLVEWGKRLIVKEKEIVEITPYHITISNPNRRILTVPFRYNNIAATIAETFWVFAGRDDLKFLSFFLPNAIDYSDDGLTWRGAYGPRLRNFSQDQIEKVILALQKDFSTRQAIITIGGFWNSDYDPNVETKDRPCTMFIQFLIRDNKLNCHVYQRSADVLWGLFNINIFEWTFLQEVINSILGTELGQYYHTVTSLHYYTDKEQRINKILDYHLQYNVYDDGKLLAEQTSIQSFKSLDDFYEDINNCMRIIELVIEENGSIVIDYQTIKSSGLRDYLRVVISYIFAKKFSLFQEAYVILGDIEGFDTYIAGLELLVRTAAKKDKSLIDKLLSIIPDIKRSEKFLLYSIS
jgi:thymidylate synthase